jgi:hypothetical protein
MATEELPEELPAVFTAVTEEDLERLTLETAQLEQLVQVRLVPSSFFDRAKPPGSVAQQRGVSCKLRCCKRYIDQKCNDYMDGDPRACPTHFEAARLLRAKVEEKHGSAECLAKAREALAAEAAAGASSTAATPVAPTVAQLMANQLAIQRAHRELKAAQQQLEQSAEAERIASEARAAASAALPNPAAFPIARSVWLSSGLSSSLRLPQASMAVSRFVSYGVRARSVTIDLDTTGSSSSATLVTAPLLKQASLICPSARFRCTRGCASTMERRRCV